jgi:group I intron endonuclease
MPNNFASGVYTIRNKVSGNVYIGSSGQFKRRFAQHRSALRGGYHQNSHLQFAWGKYGESAFEFKILVICLPEHMQPYEQQLIDGMRPVYNQSRSAFSGIPVGAKLTDKHKEKVRVASKRLWTELKYRDVVTAAIRTSMTPDECKRRSQRTKALWANPEYRKKAVEVRLGKATNLGYKCTPEQVENRRKAARISNMKRNYGVDWKVEYVGRYPEHIGDINA